MCLSIGSVNREACVNASTPELVASQDVHHLVENGAGCDVREESTPESPQHLPRWSLGLQDTGHEHARVEDRA